MKPDDHIGFCMSVYEEKTCADCLSEKECLELRDADRASPIHYVENEELPTGWYFWDETSADRCGPFSTRSRAEIALRKYCEELNQSCIFKTHLAYIIDYFIDY